MKLRSYPPQDSYAGYLADSANTRLTWCDVTFSIHSHFVLNNILLSNLRLRLAYFDSLIGGTTIIGTDIDDQVITT
jgi:hypothetical protein